MTRLVIEMFGAPGAGKSTLLPRLQSALVRRGLTPLTPRESRAQKAVQLSRFVATHSGYVSRTLRVIARSRQPSVSELAWVSSTWLKRCARMDALRQRDGLHLVDVGVLQALWSVAFRARNDVVDELVAMPELPIADVVVVVAARPHTLERRLAARSGQQSRLERAGDSVERALSLVARITAAIDTQVVIADNDALELEVVAEQVAEQIEARWRSG